MKSVLIAILAAMLVFLLFWSTPVQAVKPKRTPTKTPIAFTTATSTVSWTNTSTAVPTATETLPPINTATATLAAPPTGTPVFTSTATAVASATPIPTQQATLPPVSGASYYVTTNGSAGGDGSLARPWDLQTALNHPASVQPGDTIWVRSGTYQGNYTLWLKGAQNAPVTLRAFPGERVTLRNGGGAPVLDIASSHYTNIWGLEITSTFTVRDTSRSASSYGIRVNQGTVSHHVNFINIVVHDVLASGIGWWQALTDSDFYGSLLYYDGTTQLDHGIYIHNTTGVKRFIDNIVGDNAGYGYHGYAETTEKGLNNLQVTGNVSYNNGSIGYNTSLSKYGVYKRNILLGGLVLANSPLINNNATYYSGSAGSSLNLGYNAGSNNAIVSGNYLMGGDMALQGSNNNLLMSGNTVYAPGGYTGFSPSSYPENTWLAAKPTGPKLIVRPNRYEANRANIIVYNWSKQAVVNLPASLLTGIALQPGQAYELRNAQDFYADVVTGVYDGVSINLPMTGRSVAQPLGLNFKPASTFPEFGVFVLFAR